MVEGLTNRIVVDGLGLQPVPSGFRTYVAAYEALAEMLVFDVLEFWPHLWLFPPGSVSTAFVSVLDNVLTSTDRPSMDRREQARLFIVARGIFGTRDAMDKPNADALIAAWEKARP
jgi:hypothetical protein